MTTAWASWESSPWKNDLQLHGERALVHLAEIMDDEYDGEHNPHHMLDRAIVLAAFCVRRMHEKKVITDVLQSQTITVRAMAAMPGPEFRRPFVGSTGGHVTTNYDIANPVEIQITRWDLSNVFIHSSQLLAVYDQPGLEDGLLVTSDRDIEKCLLHLTPADWRPFFQGVLDDRVTLAKEAWDHKSGKVTFVRS